MNNNRSIHSYTRGLCRICLKSDNSDYTNLFSNEQTSKELLNTIYLCFQIVLTDENYYPCMICHECRYELNSANNFRQKCITFEEKFSILNKELLNSTPFPNENSETKDIFIIKKTDLSNDEHSNQDINEGKQNYICSLCNKVLKTETSLLKHNLLMHNKSKHPGKVTGYGVDRRYHCTQCSYSTPHSQTLINHLRRHNGERPYSCECGKSFTQSSSLSAHKKTHSNTAYYTCTVCGKQFKHAFTLKKHSRVHETAKFSCTMCSKKLKSQESLQSHMQRHYNIRNYNCEDCGDTFVTSSELLNHRKKHDGEKKVECHLCGYKTHTKKNLIVHLKRHAGDKSYRCDICHTTFFSSGDLRRHQRVHTREKPFTCPICVQRFTYSPSLNKHMLAVHNIKYRWADFKWKESRLTLKNAL